MLINAETNDSLVPEIDYEIEDLDPDYEKDVNERESEDFETVHLGTDFTYTHKIIWTIVVVYAILHAGAAVGLILSLSGRVAAKTILWSFIYWVVSVEGIMVCAHRNLAHKAYKARLPMRLINLFMQTASGQHSAYIWVRDHRLHHRYSDTDGDPHNAKRGFFFSHIGWLITKRHPIINKLKDTIDMSDMKQDKLVMFQYKYYRPLYFLIGMVIPIWVPIHFFGESFVNALFVAYFLRYVCAMHGVFLINSAAHKFGMRPYDKNIQPTQSLFTTIFSLGEGWHNYHHAFPWDYRAAELNSPLQFSTRFINFFALIGQAYDLKTVSPEMLTNRMKRYGDGNCYGDLTGMTTAVGPLHNWNPTLTGDYLEPEISKVVKIKKKKN